MRKIALGLTALIVAAVGAAVIAAEPSPSQIVVVRDSAAVVGCRALGEVQGSSMLGGMMAQAAYNRALKQIKERAAALGATHLQLIDSASGFAGARMLGSAYACPA